MSHYEIQTKKKGGIGKIFAIGCLSIFLLGIVGSVAGYFWVKEALTGFMEEYTDTQARKLPELTLSLQEAAAIAERLDRFKAEVDQGTAVEPLILTGDDINGLIRTHPDWKELSGKVYVTIEDDQVKGEVSIPLSGLGFIQEGRFLNGSANFKVDLAAGRLMVFVEAVEVKGKPLPDKFMVKMGSENLAAEVNSKPELNAILQNLESVSVENGKLIFMPKIHQDE